MRLQHGDSPPGCSGLVGGKNQPAPILSDSVTERGLILFPLAPSDEVRDRHRAGPPFDAPHVVRAVRGGRPRLPRITAKAMMVHGDVQQPRTLFLFGLPTGCQGRTCLALDESAVRFYSCLGGARERCCEAPIYLSVWCHPQIRRRV